MYLLVLLLQIPSPDAVAYISSLLSLPAFWVLNSRSIVFPSVSVPFFESPDIFSWSKHAFPGNLLSHSLFCHTPICQHPPRNLPALMDPNSEDILSLFISLHLPHSAAAKLYSRNTLLFFSQNLMKWSLSFLLSLFLKSFINETMSLRREPWFPWMFPLLLRGGRKE